MTTASRDDVGIACPRCGCRDLRTTKTMRVREGMIRRYRACRHCGRTITTHECTTRREAARRRA
jgi:transcriptional regulator NrdR family protein